MTHLVHNVLVICSMYLSGLFGWIIGEGAFPLNLVLAICWGSTPIAVAIMFGLAAEKLHENRLFYTKVYWFFGAVFLIANIGFDYSSASVVREMVAVKATNANTKADDVRTQITNLDARISKMKGEKAWTTEWQAPSVYAAEIENLKGVFIYKRSKECKDQTLADTYELCNKIASKQGDMANAQRRLKLIEELKQLESERKDLAAQSGETEHVANPALAQVKAIGAWFTGSMDPNKVQSFWIGSAVMLVMSLLLNAGIAFLAHEIGTNRAVYMARLPPPPPPVYAHALPNPNIPPAPAMLRPVPTTRTYSVNLTPDAGDVARRESLRAVHDLMGAVTAHMDELDRSKKKA